MTSANSLPKSLATILQTCRGHGGESEQNFVCDWLLPQLSAAQCPYQDEYGNVWVTTAPASRTLFTCHTDTVHNASLGQQVILHDLENGEVFKDDGQCLGADDGAGIWLLLEMIEAQVPGTYVFFRGEERGGIGSSGAATTGAEWFARFDRAIAFDRRGTGSVITHQGYGRCASNTFAQALAAGLNQHDTLSYAPDDTGVFTDTANLVDLIGECTNVSCGYGNEHTKSEYLDLAHLHALRDACLKLDWEALPSVRQPGEEEKYDTRYGYYDVRFTNPYKNLTLADLYLMAPDEIDEFVYQQPDQASALLQELLGTYADGDAEYDEEYDDSRHAPSMFSPLNKTKRSKSCLK